MSIPKPISDAATTVLSDRRYTYALVIGVLIGVAMFALWFLNIEPVSGWMATLMGYVQSTATALVSAAQTAWAGVVTTFQAQPALALTTIVTTAGGIYGIASKISADRAAASKAVAAAAQVTEAQKAAIIAGQNLTVANGQVEDLKTQIAKYENDSTLTEAQTLIQEQATQLRSKVDQIDTLEKTILDLKMKEKTVIA